MDTVPLLLGLGCAAGLTLILDGLRRRPAGAAPAVWRRRGFTAADRTRALIAVAAGLAAAVLTRWPVAALLTAAAVWALPAILGPDKEHQRTLARIEAIAATAELLSAILSGAAGLEQTITVTAPVTPTAIRPHMLNLAAAIRAGIRLPDALRAFGHDLADPTGDLVVRALLQAASHQGGPLKDCLSRLAVTAREHAGIQMRVATSRAAGRTTVRMITGTALVMIVGLPLLSTTFLAPYRSTTGQLALLLIGGVFAVGFAWLARLARTVQPPRIFGPTGRTAAREAP
jgi:Flp pilus assembly protein TadB